MQNDPVTLDIIWNRLVAICDDAEAGPVRTSSVQEIRERKDFCCVLLTPSGELIAQGSLSQIGHATVAPHTAQKVLKKFRAETLHSGDVQITNDPWLQSGHLMMPS